MDMDMYPVYCMVQLVWYKFTLLVLSIYTQYLYCIINYGFLLHTFPFIIFLNCGKLLSTSTIGKNVFFFRAVVLSLGICCSCCFCCCHSLQGLLFLKKSFPNWFLSGSLSPKIVFIEIIRKICDRQVFFKHIYLFIDNQCLN